MKSDNDLAGVQGGGPSRRVEVKRVVNAPIEQVWAALASSERQQWDGPGVIEPREGGRISSSDSDCENNGKGQDGTIKVFQRPHILEFTWNDLLDDPGLVRFDLVEVDKNSTLVTLVNFVPAADTVPAAAGWHEIVERLVAYVDTGEFVPESVDDARFKELQTVYREAGIH